jgi:hypothetical protein
MKASDARRMPCAFRRERENVHERTILLAAGSLLTAFLVECRPGNRVLAQEPVTRR